MDYVQYDYSLDDSSRSDLLKNTRKYIYIWSLKAQKQMMKRRKRDKISLIVT